MGTPLETTYFCRLPLYHPDFGPAVMKRVGLWYESLPTWHVYQRAKKVFQLAGGLAGDASPFDVALIGKAGKQGQLSQVHLNFLGNFLHRSATLVASRLPTGRPVVSSDPQAPQDASATQEELKLAEAVFEDEKRKNELPQMHREVVWAGFTTFLGWQYVGFDPRAGGMFDKGGLPMPGPDGQPALDPKTQQPMLSPTLYRGGLEYRTYALWDVMWNNTSRSRDRHWVIRKEYVNKFELADFNPNHADKILSLPPDHAKVIEHWRTTFQRPETEDVPVYYLHHLQRPGLCPEGRDAMVLGDGTVLADGPGIYGADLPCVPYSPAFLAGTILPHSPLGDLVAPQQLINMVASSATTNISGSAVRDFQLAAGGDWEVEKTAEGAQIFEVSGPQGTRLELIPAAETPPEAYKFLELIISAMQTFSGQSDVSMGRTQAGMPAQLAALLETKTLEYANLAQAAANVHVRGVYERILYIHKHHLKAPRNLEVKTGQGAYRVDSEYSGQKLKSISGVQVEESSPLMDSTAGRMDLVEKVKDYPPELRKLMLSVYSTGQLPPEFTQEQREVVLTEAENQSITRGEVPPVKNDDQHVYHIRRHCDVEQTPEARMDPRVRRASERHRMGHLEAATAFALRFEPAPGPIDPVTGMQLPPPLDDLGEPVLIPVLGPPRPDVVALLLASGQQPIPIAQAMAALMPPPMMPTSVPPSAGASSDPTGDGTQAAAPPPGPPGANGAEALPPLPPLPDNPLTGNPVPGAPPVA